MTEASQADPPPLTPPTDNSAAWIVKAESDLRGATNNVKAEEPAWDVVCFHAQQATEKYLKAVLVARGQPVPRTHDLGALLGLVAVLEPGVSIVSSECAKLEPYAVRIRYPDDLDMPNETEGTTAITAARRVREVVRRVLRLDA